MYEEHFNNQKGTIANNLFTLLMNFGVMDIFNAIF